MGRHHLIRPGVAGLLCLWAAVFGLLPSSAVAQEIDPDVKAVVLGVVEAFNAGDAAKAAESYADNALRLPPDRPPLSGRDAIQRNFEALFADNSVALKFESMGAQVQENLAVVWVYPFDIAVVPEDGSPATVDHGKWVVVLARDGRDWTIISDIWNSDLESAGTVAAAPAPAPPATQGEPVPRIAIEVRNGTQTTAIVKLKAPGRPTRQLGTVLSNSNETFVVETNLIVAGFVLVAERSTAVQMVSDPVHDLQAAKITWRLPANLVTVERL